MRPSEVSLGARLLLIVLLAAVVPLGLAGVWLTRDAGRAGEALLEERMARSLEGLVREMGSQWIQARSALLDMAESPEVLERLRGVTASEAGAAAAPATGPEEATAPAPIEIARVGDRLSAPVLEATVLDGGGRPVARFASPDPRSGPGLPVELAVHDPLGGAQLGRVEAVLSLDRFLARAPEWTAGAGGVLGVMEPEADASLLPTPFDPRLFAERRFHLGGEEWLTVRHPLSEPPVALVMAAPVEPFTLPFREAARRGTLLLLAVALTGFAAAALLTRQVTRPVRELAGAAHGVAAGDLDRRVGVRGPREVRQLARAFNTMASNLQRTLDALAKREALAAVGEFASGLAHELRNPLTAIRLDLQRVEEVSGDEARQRALMNRMLAAVRRLDRTVSGVLRVAGSGRLRFGTIPLRDPIEAAMETARPATARRSARLEGPHFPEGEEPRIHADDGAIEQLFLNLLLNAAEAFEGEGAETPAGPDRKVEVAVATVPERSLVEVQVTDTGRGIPPETLERIFDPLFSTKTGGTGLGLVIARRVARAHGGEIGVDSRSGAGTTVTVQLPAEGRA